MFCETFNSPFPPSPIYAFMQLLVWLEISWYEAAEGEKG